MNQGSNTSRTCPPPPPLSHQPCPPPPSAATPTSGSLRPPSPHPLRPLHPRRHISATPTSWVRTRSTHVHPGESIRTTCRDLRKTMLPPIVFCSRLLSGQMHGPHKLDLHFHNLSNPPPDRRADQGHTKVSSTLTQLSPLCYSLDVVVKFGAGQTLQIEAEHLHQYKSANERTVSLISCIP